MASCEQELKNPEASATRTVPSRCSPDGFRTNATPANPSPEAHNGANSESDPKEQAGENRAEERPCVVEKHPDQ